MKKQKIIANTINNREAIQSRASQPSILNPTFSLRQFATLLSLPYLFPTGIFFHDIAYDSRKVKPGDLFIALSGECVDGHDFIADAEQAGAVALLISRPVQTKLPYFIVPNVLEALGRLASDWRHQFRIPVIAVTGSNGKTTTKNMITSILSIAAGSADYCLATQGNQNTEITLPIQLLHLNESHRYTVLEMGMSHFGEIERLSRIAKPSIVVIVNAFPSHLAGVGGTIEGVARAKGEIFSGLLESGTAVLNADSEFCALWRQLALDKKIVTFGLEKHADISAKNIKLTSKNSCFTLISRKGSIDIQLPLLGRHNLCNALAAAAVCLAAGIELPTIKIGLERIETTNRRLEIMPAINGASIIDDSYNANPASTHAAIDVLATQPGRKILVLGDMRELGPDEKRYHAEMGDYARQQGIDDLFCVGELMKEAVKHFGPHAQHFVSKEALIVALKPLLHEMVTVLVKGSRSMRMDEVREQCVLKPEKENPFV